MMIFDESVKNQYEMILSDVVPWAFEELSIPESVDITFSIDDLEENEDEALRGYCLCGFADATHRDVTEFEIHLADDIHRTEVMMTIMHEMVHVKQWISGEALCEEDAEAREVELFEKYMSEIAVLSVN
ncbi:MAG: hypothetical protein ABGZ19_06985 [Verrucomicrobiales bacterium]